MLQLLRDLLRFDRQVKKLHELAPPTVKVHITETMLPWLELVMGCVSNGTTVEQARFALWQCGLYMDPRSEDGRPPEAR